MEYKTLHSQFSMTTTQMRMECAELLVLSQERGFLYPMHYVINLKEKKNIKNRDIN